MNDLLRKFLLVTLGPCLWLQGRYVRRVTPRLPEPNGPSITRRRMGDSINAEPTSPGAKNLTLISGRGMGAIFKQTIVRTDFKQFRHWAKLSGWQIVGASPAGATDYDKVRYSSPTILMLGNERSGLTPDEQSFCQKTVRIPMIEGTDSLNVAVAGSLLLYEVFRSSSRK